jgi:hypothetical protein
VTAPSVQCVPQRQATDDDELDHITECHNDDRALCGADLSDAPWVDEWDDSRLCVVCSDLDDLHCGCDCGCCDGDEETTHGD